jgi:hypothetical protein
MKYNYLTMHNIIKRNRRVNFGFVSNIKKKLFNFDSIFNIMYYNYVTSNIFL